MLEVLANATGQERSIRGIRIEKEKETTACVYRWYDSMPVNP